MAAPTTVPRLSPKVRRLLEEHDVDVRRVPGSGSAGRITPRDVLAVAGVPQDRVTGAVAASPRARRLLRDAGVDLARAAAAVGGRPLTAADARRFLEGGGGDAVLASPLARRLLREAGIDPAAASRDSDAERLRAADARRIIEADAGRAASTTAESAGADAPGTARAHDVAVTADAGRLVAHLAAAAPASTGHDGFDLPLLAPVASALAVVLARLPGAWAPSTDGPAPTVPIGIVWPGTATPTVVDDAAVLTVRGLARRAHAQARGDDTHAVDTTPVAVVLAEEDATEALVHTSAGVGVLTVGPPTLQAVEGTDEWGHTVVRHRPHLRLRLHHGDDLAAGEAREVVDALASLVATWNQPVDA